MQCVASRPQTLHFYQTSMYSHLPRPRSIHSLLPPLYSLKMVANTPCLPLAEACIRARTVHAEPTAATVVSICDADPVPRRQTNPDLQTPRRLQGLLRCTAGERSLLVCSVLADFTKKLARCACAARGNGRFLKPQ